MPNSYSYPPGHSHYCTWTPADRHALLRPLHESANTTHGPSISFWKCQESSKLTAEPRSADDVVRMPSDVSWVDDRVHPGDSYGHGLAEYPVDTEYGTDECAKRGEGDEGGRVARHVGERTRYS